MTDCLHTAHRRVTLYDALACPVTGEGSGRETEETKQKETIDNDREAFYADYGVLFA